MRSAQIVMVVTTIAALAAPVIAEDKADALFKKGKKLLDQKRYAEACEAFEKSDKLDATIGTKLNIAKCFEDWGKVATALKWYRLAETAAKEAKDDRLAKIHEHLVEVDGDTPRLTLRTAKDADTTVVVLLDGAPAILDEAIEIDPGAHVVEYPTEGGAMKKKVVPVERGSESDVKLDLPKRKPGQIIPPKKGKADEPPPKPKVVVDDPDRTRRMLGYLSGGVGLASIGVSTYLTLSARGDYRDALASHCNGSASNCDPQGLSITHDARSKANLSTVVFSLGAVALAGGIYLFVTAEKPTTHKLESADEEGHAYYLAPSIAEHGGGVVFGGRY